MWSFGSVSHFRPLVRRVDLTCRLVKSCGLHRIPSSVFSPAPAPNPFLRNRPYLLTPPEDALELGERIHTLYVASPLTFLFFVFMIFAFPHFLASSFVTPILGSIEACFDASLQNLPILLTFFSPSSLHSAGFDRRRS